METYTIIIISFGVIALLLLILLFFINRLTILKNIIEKSFLPVKTNIEERVNIINDMISFLKEKAKEEETLEKELENTKTSLENIKNAQDGIITIKETKKTFIKFSELNNIYEKLNKDKDFILLKEKYKNNENKINYALESYNKGVKDYNNYKEKKIINLLSNVVHFPE